MLGFYTRLLPRYRSYILAASIIFALSIALGAWATVNQPDLIHEAFQMVGQQLERLGQDILGGNVLRGILLLFLHNLRALLLIAAIGLALGVYPMLAMLANGMLIGIFAVLTTQSVSLAAFVAGILPHGILEIPALIIGAGIGLRLGLAPIFSRPRSRFAVLSPTDWQGYRTELQHALGLLSLCALLLLSAAIIEVAITPSILQLFL